MPIMYLPAINHLLSKEAWARAKLAAHAGKIACLDAGAVVLRLRVMADGLVEEADAASPANVTIRLKLADLPLLLQNRERAFSYVSIEGDADFANSISQVSQHLEWEVEADLAPWVGDIAANRIVAGAKSVVQTARATHQSLAENITEFLTEEQPVLLRPQAVRDMAGDINKTRDDVERLIKRIEKLESRIK